MTTQLIAMHGWAGDSRGWQPFAAAAGRQGWRWQAPDRGYGPAPAQAAHWSDGASRKVLIAHSLGPQLLPAELLEQTEAVVLLASFGRFVPPGRAGRRLHAALAGMAQALRGPEPDAMLRQFLSEAAAPQPLSQLPATIIDQPLTGAARRQLLADLELLGATTALPAALPAAIPCLIVEAGADRIVGPEARALLRQERPHADLIHYPEAGHCLLGAPVVHEVMGWIANL